MVVSLWLSVIAASNDLNLALPQAPNSAQAAPPQILQVGFWQQLCCSALQGIILMYFSNCKLYFFKLQSVFAANSASWGFGHSCAVQGIFLLLQSEVVKCGAVQCSNSASWLCCRQQRQLARLSVARRTPFKACR